MKCWAGWSKWSYNRVLIIYPIKSRDYFANKGPHSQRCSFSSSHVWIWELEHKKSWALKNWCFWTVVLEKTLKRVPWTARKSNQSILKEISPEYSLEGLMLKLKPQYSGHLMWRNDSLERTLMLGKIEGGRRRGDRGWDGWMASRTQRTWVWVSSGSWWWTGRPGVLQSTGSQRVGQDWATEPNWIYLRSVYRSLYVQLWARNKLDWSWTVLIRMYVHLWRSTNVSDVSG